jgi:hypothetical protein
MGATLIEIAQHRTAPRDEEIAQSARIRHRPTRVRGRAAHDRIVSTARVGPMAALAEVPPRSPCRRQRSIGVVIDG